MSLSPNTELAIDRWPEVSQITGFRSKSHVENLERLGLFPRSVKIGSRPNGWVHSEIIGWLQQRIADSSKGSFKGAS